MTIKQIFVFPGQGSQMLGMGQQLAENFAEARLVFQEVDDALELHLSKIMWGEDMEALTRTENAQPAIMAVSMAVLRVLEKQGNISLSQHATFAAGHSLGEYSALCAAGTFSLADTARLLKIRGQAMQKAVPIGQGAMAAILGLELAQVSEIADKISESALCSVANDNSPGQIVISGKRAGVEQALVLAKEFGAKRSMLLPVSAPFHCVLMAPAAEAMQKALAEVAMHKPVVPIICNITAQPIQETAAIQQLLVEQVTGRVRWRESMIYAAEQEVMTVVELGAGKVLSGLAKRIDKGFTCHAMHTPEEVTAYLTAI